MVTMRLLLPKWHWQYLPAIGRNLPANAWDVDTRVQSLGCFPSGIGSIYLHWQESTCQCMRRRHSGSIPGSGRSLEGGNGNSLQYSCLENPMDRGAWLQPIGSQRIGPKQLSMKHASTFFKVPGSYIQSNEHIFINTFMWVLTTLHSLQGPVQGQYRLGNQGRIPLEFSQPTNLPALQETRVWEDPLGKGFTTHSSTLAWRIPWTDKAWWATVHGVAKSQTGLSD